MSATSGVVGINVWNVVIVGVIALVFVMGYNYVQSKYLTSLPVA